MGTTDKAHSDFSVRVVAVLETEVDRVLEGYRLLQEAMGVDAVEDIGSFRRTVSTATDTAVVPKLVGATRRSEMVGFSVGTYLRNLNMGFILYSAVRKEWRRRGIYTAMRDKLVSELDDEAGARRSQAHRVSYVVSEQVENSRLHRRYVREWGAFVLPLAYEQPAVQGLRARELKLVVQPLGRQTPPDGDEIVAIVREVYERIYRIHDAANHPTFRRVVASLPDLPVQGAVS